MGNTSGEITSADCSDLMDLHGATKGFLRHPPVHPSRAGPPSGELGQGGFGMQGGFWGTGPSWALTLCRSYTICFSIETTELWCNHDSQRKASEETREKMKT